MADIRKKLQELLDKLLKGSEKKGLAVNAKKLVNMVVIKGEKKTVANHEMKMSTSNREH